jgi:hypothetical protein
MKGPIVVVALMFQSFLVFVYMHRNLLCNKNSFKKRFFHGEEIFLYKKTIVYVFITHSEDIQAPGEASCPAENSSSMKFLHFFLVLKQF